MAIGTALAVGLGSAVIGAGSRALAASKNSKAIKSATAAQTDANREAIAAQERARAENLGLQRPLYDAGMPALQARNALLGLGGQQVQQQPNALAQFQGYNPDSSGGTMGMRDNAVWDQYLSANPDVYQGWQQTGQAYDTPQAYAQFHYGQFGRNEGRELPGQISAQAGPATTQQSAENAFDIFKNSTGYQFRVNEGNRALNAGWAGAGTLQSGAAGKSFQNFGQNIASAEFGNYMGYLGEQQNLTSGAANAMSGVNSTYANNAGNLAVAQGQNLANAAVARANNSNALIGGLGNALGTGLGAFAFPKG